MSGGHSKSSSKAQSFVDPSQAPFLAALRSQSLQTQQQQQQAGIGTQDFFNQALSPLQAQGGQALGGLQDIISGANPEIAQLRERAGEGNPFVDQLIEQTQGDISRNLQQNILPSIGSAAAGLGQRGSSRQGIAEGLATQDAQRLGAEAATDIRFQNFGQQGAALSSILANQQAAIGQTFPALGGQFGLSQAQVNAPFLSLQNLGQLFGPANILNTSKSSSFSMQGGVG